MPETEGALRATLRRLCLAALAAVVLSAPAAGQAAEPAGAATPGGIPCAPDRITLIGAEGAHGFDIELALTPDQQRVGLMFRASMPADAGMLFVFDPPREAAFWMKNTMIPLDMLFIDAGGRVLNIAAMTTPYTLRSYVSAGQVRAVLEINGGRAAALGIAAGAQAVHPAFDAAPADHACPAP